LTAQNYSLFEIDAELEAAFDELQEEREITGNISDESRERCVQLFAELGKKIDRIAAYLRIQQHKANIVGEEAQRLQQRRRSAEQRVNDVKEMLTYFMRCRGLKRLEGELNTIRLQTNSQASLQSPGVLSAYRKHPTSLVERDAGVSSCRAERRIPAGHDQHPTQYPAGPGCTAAGRNRQRSPARTRMSHPDRLAWVRRWISRIFHRKEVSCMLRLKINLRVRRSVHVKCLRHPRYNPEREGAGAIRGGCRYCQAI
jgi:hypothetical protein